MQLAASAGMDGRLCIWDLGSLALRHTCMHPAGVIQLAWLKGSPMLITCAVSRELRLWDGRSGDCLQTLTGHVDAVLTFDVGYTAQGIYVVRARAMANPRQCLHPMAAGTGSASQPLC
jgi:ribosome assembly protein SQT1